jgi:hypothetical protein
MLNDTTKPGEVLHKGGLDLLTLLHRRDVELHAHLTLWCSNDDQQRCEHFVVAGFPAPVRKGEQRSRYANGCDGLVFLRRKENPASRWSGGVPGPCTSGSECF